jgi:hypothetical protein
MALWPWLTVVLLATLAMGCARSVPVPPPANLPSPTEPTSASATPQSAKSPQPAPAPANPSVTPSSEGGIISGLVLWEGPADAGSGWGTAKLTVSVGGQRRPAKPASRLRVDPTTHGVADAIVWVVNPPEEAANPPTESVALTQRDGDCQPHVLAARRGSRLQLGSADDKAVFHATGAADFIETVLPGAPMERVLDRSGLVEVRSDLLPWMCGYIHVLEHRFFARSAPDGRFRLPPLPAGTYQVMLWHEGWRITDPAEFKVAAPSQVEVAQVTVDPAKGQGASLQWVLHP